MDGYWIVDPCARTVEQYFIEADRFGPARGLDGATVIASRVIREGFTAPVNAFFDEKADLAGRLGG